MPGISEALKNVVGAEVQKKFEKQLLEAMAAGKAAKTINHVKVDIPEPAPPDDAATHAANLQAAMQVLFSFSVQLPKTAKLVDYARADRILVGGVRRTTISRAPITREAVERDLRKALKGTVFDSGAQCCVTNDLSDLKAGTVSTMNDHVSTAFGVVSGDITFGVHDFFGVKAILSDKTPYKLLGAFTHSPRAVGVVDSLAAQTKTEPYRHV